MAGDAAATPLPRLEQRNYRCIAWRAGVDGPLASGPAKKRANRNKSLDISGATHRQGRLAAPRRHSEGKRVETGWKAGCGGRDARTFLIYEQAYFLGLLHMDIRARARWHAASRGGCENRAERTRWNFNASFQALFPPRWPILFFLPAPLGTALVNRGPLHTLIHAWIDPLSSDRHLEQRRG